MHGIGVDDAVRLWHDIFAVQGDVNVGFQRLVDTLNKAVDRQSAQKFGSFTPALGSYDSAFLGRMGGLTVRVRHGGDASSSSRRRQPARSDERRVGVARRGERSKSARSCVLEHAPHAIRLSRHHTRRCALAALESAPGPSFLAPAERRVANLTLEVRY
jgi:hypothetical protein